MPRASPEKPDTDGDVADATVIREAAHYWMRSGAQLDIEHDGKVLSKSQAYVAESFIVQPGDPRFVDARDRSGNKIDSVGSWATITRIEDPAIRKEIDDLFIQHGMIVFEDVEQTDAMQLAISSCFGPLKEHPVKSLSRVDSEHLPGVIEIRVAPDHGGIVELNGKQVGMEEIKRQIERLLQQNAITLDRVQQKINEYVE